MRFLSNPTGRKIVMSLTGLLIALYLIYHILHSTLQIILPETSAGRNPDALGRTDVYPMMQSFHKTTEADNIITTKHSKG